MDGEFRGRSLVEAVQKSLQPELSKRNLVGAAQKGRFDVWAPPMFWGPWTPIWVSLGLTGPNQFNERTVMTVSFDSISAAPSSFGVEINGGDKLVRANGPGSARVLITGNHATTLSIRCKSHSIGQHVVVTI